MVPRHWKWAQFKYKKRGKVLLTFTINVNVMVKEKRWLSHASQNQQTYKHGTYLENVKWKKFKNWRTDNMIQGGGCQGGQGSESVSMKNSIVGREKRRGRMGMGNRNYSKARVYCTILTLSSHNVSQRPVKQRYAYLIACHSLQWRVKRKF